MSPPKNCVGKFDVIRRVNDKIKGLVCVQGSLLEQCVIVCRDNHEVRCYRGKKPVKHITLISWVNKDAPQSATKRIAA
jgi:hypothetical protein